MTIDSKKLRELCDAAPPGPWQAGNATIGADGMAVLEPFCGDCEMMVDGHDESACWERTKNAVTFIAAAREAVPQLLDEVDRLRQELFAFQRRALPWLELAVDIAADDEEDAAMLDELITETWRAVEEGRRK